MPALNEPPAESPEPPKAQQSRQRDQRARRNLRGAVCRPAGRRWSSAAPARARRFSATAFLVRGARRGHEPGVLVSFDEAGADLEINTSSLGWDLQELERRKLLAIEHVQVDRQQIIEAGEYDLEGLFIRLAYAVDTVKARRVVLDSIDTCSPTSPTRRCSAPSSGGCSPGSRTGAFRRSSPGSEATRISPAMASRSTFRTA